jgi:hypothetical protein
VKENSNEQMIFVSSVLPWTNKVVNIDLHDAVAFLDGNVAISDELAHAYNAAQPSVRDQIDHLVFVLGGSPSTNDAFWGRNHALDRSADGVFRLSVALQVVGLRQGDERRRQLRFVCDFEDRFCVSDEARSRTVDVERVWMREPTREPPEHGAFVFMNGIHMSFSAAINHDLPQVARWLGAGEFARTRLIFNGDKGLLQYVEVAAGFQQTATLPAFLLLHEFFAFFERRTRGRLLVTCFSGGATHAAVAVSALPSELQAKIAVLALGTSFFVDPSLRCQVAHIAKRSALGQELC